MKDKQRLFGIDIDNVTMADALVQIEKMILNKTLAYVVTPNVDHIIQLQTDQIFREIYSQADMILADGMPIIWVSKLLSKPLKEKVSGADLVPHIFKLAEEHQYKIFILGSEEGVAKELVDKVIASSVNPPPISYYSPPFGFEKGEAENQKIINLINNFLPDILLVSLGAPKGEKWIYQHKNDLKVPVSIQVGAAIDFMAGSKKRAPKWMQKSGLEWFYRFLQEPKRMFKRYFIRDSKFILVVLKELWQKKRRENGEK